MLNTLVKIKFSDNNIEEISLDRILCIPYLKKEFKNCSLYDEPMPLQVTSDEYSEYLVPVIDILDEPCGLKEKFENLASVVMEDICGFYRIFDYLEINEGLECIDECINRIIKDFVHKKHNKHSKFLLRLYIHYIHEKYNEEKNEIITKILDENINVNTKNNIKGIVKNFTVEFADEMFGSLKSIYNYSIYYIAEYNKLLYFLRLYNDNSYFCCAPHICFPYLETIKITYTYYFNSFNNGVCYVFSDEKLVYYMLDQDQGITTGIMGLYDNTKELGFDTINDKYINKNCINFAILKNKGCLSVITNNGCEK